MPMARSERSGLARPAAGGWVGPGAHKRRAAPRSAARRRPPRREVTQPAGAAASARCPPSPTLPPPPRGTARRGAPGGIYPPAASAGPAFTPRAPAPALAGKNGEQGGARRDPKSRGAPDNDAPGNDASMQRTTDDDAAGCGRRCGVRSRVFAWKKSRDLLSLTEALAECLTVHRIERTARPDRSASSSRGMARVRGNAPARATTWSETPGPARPAAGGWVGPGAHKRRVAPRSAARRRPPRRAGPTSASDATSARCPTFPHAASATARHPPGAEHRGVSTRPPPAPGRRFLHAHAHPRRRSLGGSGEEGRARRNPPAPRCARQRFVDSSMQQRREPGRRPSWLQPGVRLGSSPAIHPESRRRRPRRPGVPERTRTRAHGAPYSTAMIPAWTAARLAAATAIQSRSPWRKGRTPTDRTAARESPAPMRKRVNTSARVARKATR